MKKTLLLILAFAVSATGYAQSQDNTEKEKLVSEYIKAYTSLDIDGMLALYHDDIAYIDETYLDASGNTANLVGKETIKEMFTTQFFPLVKKIEFKETKRYYAGNQGVFQGTLVVHYKGNAAGKTEEDTLLWSTDYVKVITFKDGKIVRHNDFINYLGGSREWQ